MCVCVCLLLLLLVAVKFDRRCLPQPLLPFFTVLLVCVCLPVPFFAFFSFFSSCRLLGAAHMYVRVCVCAFACPYLSPPFPCCFALSHRPPTNQPKRKGRSVGCHTKSSVSKRKKEKDIPKNSVFHKHTKVFIHTRHTTPHRRRELHGTEKKKKKKGHPQRGIEKELSVFWFTIRSSKSGVLSVASNCFAVYFTTPSPSALNHTRKRRISLPSKLINPNAMCSFRTF